MSQTNDFLNDVEDWRTKAEERLWLWLRQEGFCLPADQTDWEANALRPYVKVLADRIGFVRACEAETG